MAVGAVVGGKLFVAFVVLLLLLLMVFDVNGDVLLLLVFVAK